MSSLLHTFVLSRRTPWLRLQPAHRWYTRYHGTKVPSFEAIGIDHTVVRALGKAFPNVQQPTAAQAQYIPAILDGKDVLLKGETGSGKSFGLVLALLNQPRKFWREEDEKPVITSLLITPHRDLAYQFMHWIGSILDVTPEAMPLPTVAQVLLRNASVPIHDQIKDIISNSPQILIATPQALLEAFHDDSAPLDLRGISAVVVDEADYLLETISTGLEKHKRSKLEQNLERHPSPTRQILNLIYGSKRKISGQKPQKRFGSVTRENPAGVFYPRPQLILSSATLRATFRQSVLHDGWLTSVYGNLVKVGEDSTSPDAPVRESAITHCALVVSEEGEATNIAGAIEQAATEPTEDDTTSTEEIPLTIDPVVEGISQEDIAVFESQPSPFNQAALEVLAAAFAMDVPRVALLVLPAEASVRRAVFDLRMLGVNAHGLDVLDTTRGGAYLLRHGTQPEANPTLLVSTLATTRGLDLPDLTHVFILGVTEALTTDTYLHAAGRVGRFGRPGKVITILESRRQVMKKQANKIGFKDEPKWLNKIYRAIGVTPTKFEHFGEAEEVEEPRYIYPGKVQRPE
ncbi:P-loop containing nucleoside triphosphate hydrolase protein [Trametopsis cervina]|nr:P-loop containing nucleoside triphosphate hydrolase protein [Trametopsis cervina]